METLAQELNLLCAPINPAQYWSRWHRWRSYVVESSGDGGRNPRVDSWPRHGLVERAGLAAVVLSLLSFPSGGILPAGGAGASPLPRMTGRPSLPVPITMTFEFVDCES